MQKTANHLRGFTLIELLVVVVLIGVLFAVALPMFENAGRKDTEKAAFQLISTLRLARQYAISKRQWTLVVFPNKDGGPYNGVGGNNLDKCMRSYAVIAVTNNMDRLDRKDQTPDNMKFSFVSDWKYLPEGMYFDDTWEPGGTATNGNWIFRYRVPDVYKYPYDPARPNDQNASRPMSVLMFKPNGRQFTAREDGIAGGTFWRDDPNSKIYISSAKYYEKTATGLTDPPQVLPGGTNTVLMLNNKTGQVNIWDGQN